MHGHPKHPPLAAPVNDEGNRELNILRDVFGKLPNVVTLQDQDGRILLANQAVAGELAALALAGVFCLVASSEVQRRAMAADGIASLLSVARTGVGDKNGIASSLCYLGLVALAEGDHAPARALLEESLGLRQDMDDKPGMARSLLGLGLMDLAEGKPEAREHILGSLRLGTGELRLEPSSLIGVAGLALQEDAPLFAAQMLGAVQSALTPLGLVVEPMMNFFHAQTLAKVKAALGETDFQAAWKEGSLWSLAEAVRRAQSQ